MWNVLFCLLVLIIHFTTFQLREHRLYDHPFAEPQSRSRRILAQSWNSVQVWARLAGCWCNLVNLSFHVSRSTTAKAPISHKLPIAITIIRSMNYWSPSWILVEAVPRRRRFAKDARRWCMYCYFEAELSYFETQCVCHWRALNVDFRESLYKNSKDYCLVVSNIFRALMSLISNMGKKFITIGLVELLLESFGLFSLKHSRITIMFF